MKNDQIILDALTSGVLRYDQKTGSVFAPRSNTPDKPVGAITKKGYLRTCITQKDKAATVMVHRIACIAAYGFPAPNQFVNHKNGVKTDNSAENLEWVTVAENAAHASKIGLLRPPKQEHHYASKLTNDQISEIRASSEPSTVLSDRYGVSSAHIRRIKTGKRWTDDVQADRRKKSAGRLLDGVLHDEYPEVAR